jgi:hypothetical protein
MHLSVRARFSILAFTALTFAALAACSDDPEPVTIIKEVPVEKVVEVEKIV